MPPTTRSLMREFSQLQADRSSGALRYTNKGTPTTIPSSANATERLMQQMNAEAVARGSTPSFPSVPAPTRLEAREFVPIPTPAPRVSLPELPKIPPGITSVPPSSSTAIGNGAALTGRVALGANAGADFGLRIASGQNIGEAALGTGLSLGGAVAGAEAGAALGTIFFSGVGTAIGGAAGGVLGGLGGSLLANKLGSLFHPNRSSNLPDYLELRGQRVPVALAVGTYFEVTFSSPGRTDVYRVHDLTEASARRTQEQ